MSEMVIVRRQDGYIEKVNTETVDLKFLQQQVGGYVEFVPGEWFKLDENTSLVINEEGKILQLGINMPMHNSKGKIIDILFGKIVAVGMRDGDIVGLNQEQEKMVMKLFEQDYRTEMIQYLKEVFG